MSRKGGLPDSLELLLDTMCNTFGGIVFIAISLIIISQLVTDKVKKTSPEELDEQRMEQIKKDVEKLEELVTQKRREIADRNFTTQTENPEKQRAIQDLKHLTQELFEQEKDYRTATVALQAATIKHQRLTNEKVTSTKKIELTKKIDALKLKQFRQQRDKLRKDLKQKENDLKATPTRTMRFSLEQPTSLSPLWVFIQKQQLYRYDHLNPDSYQDVTPIPRGRETHFTYVHGHDLGNHPKEKIAELFRGVSPHQRYIDITADDSSFQTLLHTRRQLRAMGFKVSWFIDANPYLIRSSQARHTASD